MEKIEGVYVGQERQVRMYGSITDTTWDSVYDQIITVKLYEKDWYEFTKTVEPTTFDCPAKSLVRYGTYSSKDGFILKTSTKVTADGDNLSYEIEVNNS